MSKSQRLPQVKTFIYESLQLLQDCSLEVSGRLVDASNATLLATGTCGNISFQCIYKPEAGERPLWDFSSGTLAKREFAAFEFSRLMEDFIVPPTVLRDGPFGLGIVQLWIDVDPDIDLMEYFQKDDDQLRKLALYDAVINNTDRKIGHLLPRNDGKLFACDHGVTFHEDDKLRTVLWQWAELPLTDLEKVWLNRAREVAADPGFEALLEKSEITALDSRILRLLETGVFPSPSDEWPAVPWPPF